MFLDDGKGAENRRNVFVCKRYPFFFQAGTSEHADSVKQTEQRRTDDIVKLVVRVFVDAVPYVPEHRRILLFEHLSTVLGAESSLYIVIAILLEKLVVQMNKKAEGDDQVCMKVLVMVFFGGGEIGLLFLSILDSRIPWDFWQFCKEMQTVFHFQSCSSLYDSFHEIALKPSPKTPELPFS